MANRKWWTGAVVSLGLLAWLTGCSADSYGRRSDGVAQTLKEHGIEARHGKIKRVFRF